MIFLIFGLSIEKFIEEVKNHYQIKFYDEQIKYLNLSKWSIISSSNVMFEYNSMFENGYISFGYEFHPSVFFEFKGYENELSSVIYRIIRQKNEFLYSAIEDYLKTLEIKSEIEIQKKILENYLKIQDLLETQYKYLKSKQITRIMLNESKITTLKTKLKSLEIEYERYMNKLNFYTKVDSVEDIEKIPVLDLKDVEYSIDYKILNYELISNENYLRASYLRIFPSIKPSILRRVDNTYGFMVAFSIPIYPLNEINKNKLKFKSSQNYSNSIKNLLKTRIFEIRKDYERFIIEYENYEKQKQKLEEALNSLLTEYKFSNEVDFRDYYELLNDILNLELEKKRAKYKAILKFFEYITLF
ncbi:MAG: hypothetical protein ABIL37_04215 [candidate division WOR-3 bacterium]